MLHALGPAQIADVDQAVDSVFDLDEGAEVGQIANATFYRHADWELLMQGIHGFGASWRMPSEMRRSVGFTFRTSTH